MGRAKKVVLAYSGGVDTSVCIPYLKQEWGVEDVITFAADLGQGDELEPIRQKALDAGASQSLVGDLCSSSKGTSSICCHNHNDNAYGSHHGNNGRTNVH